MVIVGVVVVVAWFVSFQQKPTRIEIFTYTQIKRFFANLTASYKFTIIMLNIRWHNRRGALPRNVAFYHVGALRLNRGIDCFFFISSKKTGGSTFL